ncbi:hypothetical protein [Evansella cellulosilytica]|uniref:Uncharacterized protein n=1 Tax=Evansella cellulosilytica (strain ATCC 21833 / DSM 2522 / FERM P-1141 / JCM 9156 / N-4) TaxID=649639 RepID=E6TRW1_EVAC2|nr:hypothetical protein [Evansella cellulosilytica]ADU29484.1 hypothetical protein Bcell_1219 [Evansella cellulosilytica DSM 2522]
MTQLGGDIEINKRDIDEAINKATLLGIKGEEKDSFVRSFLISISSGKEIESKEQVYEESQWRMLYERTWQELAFERYGVELTKKDYEK